MKTGEEDPQEIIEQIRRLQTEQDVLLARLVALSIRDHGGGRRQKTAYAEVEREFAVGDPVTIKNPGLLQANKGKIEKIGKSRIAVKTSTGRVIGAPKNLSFQG